MTTTSTYVGPSAQQIAVQLSDRAIRPSQGWWRVRGICHGGTTFPGSLTIRDQDPGGIGVNCFAGCERRAVIDALEAATGWRIWDAWDDSQSAPIRTDPAERQRQIERARVKQREQERLAAEAASKAQQMIDTAGFEPHPYLALKGFPEERGFVLDGELLIPMRHFTTRTLQSVQRISEDGSKKYLYGSVTKQAALTLGPPVAPSTWYCEGYATALSVRAALEHLYRHDDQVVVCFSAANVVHVAGRHGFVVADHDRWKCVNRDCRHRWDAPHDLTDPRCPSCKGAKLARPVGQKYASRTGLTWWMSPEPGDANDFHQQHGVKALANQLREVLNVNCVRMA